MTEYRIRRKPGYVLRVDNLTDDRVEGYWNMKHKRWFSLDWLESGSDLLKQEHP